MISHVVKLVPAKGRSRDLVDMIDTVVIPIIQRYPGFVDELVLVPDVSPNEILAISFWRSKAESENFTRNGFSEITNLVKELVAKPTLRIEYDVEVSTNPKILVKNGKPIPFDSSATRDLKQTVRPCDMIFATMNPIAMMRMSQRFWNELLNTNR